ncbi:retrovirus-related pol polyprotein from transposon TNT 1-94 [Tanacetum coccineum]
MHNNIMAAGSRDRPPMLATRRYAQWQSRFMRYVDTKPNGEALRKCILQGPYKLSNIIIPGQPTTDSSPEVPERTVLKTFSNITPENKAHYDAEKEPIHLLLTRIGDKIYSAGESLNKQDVKTSLFWEFGRFTSRVGESIDSYYSRFYKMMNEMTGQYGNQRTVTVVGARETIGSQIVQQTGIQYFNCKEFGHFAKKCRKPKRTKDYTYHKERMLLYKQAEKGVPLQAEQADWLEDKDEEIDEQELEAHYSFMAKIQEVLPADSDLDLRNTFGNIESINNTCVVEKVDSNVIPDSLDMCDNDNQADQNAKEFDNEHDVLANLIVNLKLDTDENKKIKKQLKKANTSLSHELQECKFTLEE